MTLTIEVELLSGRYVATAFNDRTRPEWPPHPARLFSAAVATWADAEHPDPEERNLLRWLERQPAPAITCSAEVAVRTTTTHFVPVNDPATTSAAVESAYAGLSDALEHAKLAGTDTKSRDRVDQARRKAREASAGRLPKTGRLKTLPDHRGRQARTFPSVTPEEARVVFAWPQVEPTREQRATLDALLARVGRLGHSSSLVSCRVGEAAPPPTFIPDNAGGLVLRVPGEGQLELLDEEHERHRGVRPRTLPFASQPYSTSLPTPDAGAPRSIFSARWITFALRDEDPLSIRASLPLARALRAALIEHSGESAPPLLTGREVTGGEAMGPPMQGPHAAFIALPFVGHPHADGLVRGLAVIAPHGAEDGERQALARGIGLWEAATGGVLRIGARELRLIRTTTGDQLVSLRPSAWCQPAEDWTTVTPIALDRFPGDLSTHDPELRRKAEDATRATIVRACGHIGLPAPATVDPVLTGPLTGVPAARLFPTFTTPNGGARRVLVHAYLRFQEPVAGPIVLGAGRYVGQGLCWPTSTRPR